MIFPDPYRETFEGAVHGSHGISRGVRKLARTSKVIKKKKKNPTQGSSPNKKGQHGVEPVISE